jgi:membrane protein DedA with SNARE-associated domain
MCPVQWAFRVRRWIFNNRLRRRAAIGLGLAATCAAIWLKGHFALFAWMVASGLGVPPGEDLLIAGTGAFVANGDLTLWVAIPLAVAAVVTSDTLLFSGGQVARSSMSGKATWWSDQVARYIEALVGRREALAIAIARFVPGPGLRTLVFVSVGARGLPRSRFLLIDTCAAAAWVPLAMTCGAALVSRLFGAESLMPENWI